MLKYCTFVISALALSATMLMVSGCFSEPANPPVTFQRDALKAAPPTEVKKQGLFALFPGDGISPLEAVYLHPGDEYGFKFSDGKAVGCYTAGGVTKLIPLDGVLTSEYVWKYEGDKQP